MPPPLNGSVSSPRRIVGFTEEALPFVYPRPGGSGFHERNRESFANARLALSISGSRFKAFSRHERHLS
jgi:hypothetical protein